jgi:aminoglycoside phosphotransferase (APT) family kinase protein
MTSISRHISTVRMVPDSVMWAAMRDALGSGIDAHQWMGVADYAARRGDDPWPARASELAVMLDCAPDVTEALETASRQLSADLGESALRTQMLEWMREDIETASPLLTVFTGHGTDVEHARVLVSDEDRDALARWLSDEHGSPVDVTHAELIGGGFSRRMWRTQVSGAGLNRSVIVRIEQGGMFGTDTVTEVVAMRALRGVGYRVPEILHVEASGAVLGEPFFVMEEVQGEVRLDDEGLNDVIRSVAELHALPSSVLDTSGRTPERVVADNIDGWLALYRAHSPIPIPLIEHAAQWLHERLRPTGPSVVVHGDAGPGNALFSADTGLTVLDWEFAHVGDPAEDWVYLALIRGRKIMDGPAWKERLRSTVGVEFNDEQWHNWLAFNHFRGACVNLTARTVFEQGPLRTADQLAIGVAVHLRFLGQLTEITCAS